MTIILAATVVLASDPATDLVRTQTIVTTTASSVDLTVDVARLANAVFTIHGGDSSVRTRIDGNTIQILDNTAGGTIDVRIDMILANWQSAIAMQADWIVVTSWNEWWENTEIEPSQRFGDFYLRRTASWASFFRLLHAERPISSAPSPSS